MLFVTKVVVFAISARSPFVLATICGKVIDKLDANPCKEGYALARSHWSEGSRFESWCRLDFSLKISNKVYLHDDLEVQFVHHVRMSSLNCIMYQHRYLRLMSISKSLSEMLYI